MSLPNWYQLLLLGLAAWRTFELLANDEITRPLRNRILQLPAAWKTEGDPISPDEWTRYRRILGEFVVCPYCLGFWIAIIWWGIWEITPHWTTIFAVPFALSAIVVGAAKILSK